MSRFFLAFATLFTFLLAADVRDAVAQPPGDADAAAIKSGLADLQTAVAGLKQKKRDARLVADVEVFAKSVEWALRHNEFYLPAPPKNGQKPMTPPKSKYPQFALNAIKSGLHRADEVQRGQPSWPTQVGKTIRGYVSKVDGSVQPYALTLPEGLTQIRSKRWPLHVVLHGRGGDRNEIRFIEDHDGKPLPKDQNWIQLDVFGRIDNAYRWAGESDVFEAMADVKRRYRVDGSTSGTTCKARSTTPSGNRSCASCRAASRGPSLTPRGPSGPTSASRTSLTNGCADACPSSKTAKSLTN